MTAQRMGIFRSLGIAMILVGMPAIAGIAAGEIQDRQSAKLQRTASALVFETQLLKESRPDLADYDEVRLFLVSRSEIMESLAADRFVLAGLMESLSGISGEITLLGIRFDRGMLEVEGSARNEEAIGNLVARMQAMPGWTDIVVRNEAQSRETSPIFRISARHAVEPSFKRNPVR